MFKIELLFDKGLYFLFILIYCLSLFSLSYFLLYLGYGNPKFVIVLKVPLISFIIFQILFFMFKKIFKRNPENTFWVFVKKPIQDVLFSMFFWILGVGLPLIIV